MLCSHYDDAPYVSFVINSVSLRARIPSPSPFYSQGLLWCRHTRCSTYVCWVNGTRSWRRHGFCLPGFPISRRSRTCPNSSLCRALARISIPGGLQACSLEPPSKERKEGRTQSMVTQPHVSALSNPSSHLCGWIKWPIQRVPGPWQSIFFKVNLLWGPGKES